MHGKNAVLMGVFAAKNELDLYKSFIRRYKESGYIIKAVEIKDDNTKP